MHAKKGERQWNNHIVFSSLPPRRLYSSRRYNKQHKSVISKTAEHSQMNVTENYCNREERALMATRQCPAMSQTLQQTPPQMPEGQHHPMLNQWTNTDTKTLHEKTGGSKATSRLIERTWILDNLLQIIHCPACKNCIIRLQIKNIV